MSSDETILVKTIRADLCRPPYYVPKFTINNNNNTYLLHDAESFLRS